MSQSNTTQSVTLPVEDTVVSKLEWDEQSSYQSIIQSLVYRLAEEETTWTAKEVADELVVQLITNYKLNHWVYVTDEED